MSKFDFVKMQKLAVIGRRRGECASELYERDGDNAKDTQLSALAKRLADKIVDSYDLFVGFDIETESRAQFAWTMADAYCELPKSPIECAFLSGSIDFYLLKDHDIDVQAERDARSALLKAKLYESGVK